MFNGRTVEDAGVLVFNKKDSKHPIIELKSHLDSSFVIHPSYLSKEMDEEYFVCAYHHDFGFARSSNFRLEKNSYEISLNLIKEEYIPFKLIFSNGEPFPYQKITFNYSSDNPFFLSESIVTNANGEGEISSMILVNCKITINSDKYKIENNSSLNNNLTKPINLIAVKKNLKKINIVKPGGELYNGALEGTIISTGSCYPLEIIRDNKNNSFLLIDENFNFGPHIILFDAPGYATIRKGSFLNAESLPEEFNLELILGASLAIKVIDDQNKKPLGFAKVEVKANESHLIIVPANQSGEVLLNHLNGNYEISISMNGFVPFKQEIFISESKEVIVNLVKGGELVGKWLKEKEVEFAVLSLILGNEKFEYFLFGDFSFQNIKPGVYMMSLTMSINGKIIIIELNSKDLNIENDKVTAINIDEIIKK
jgi:hypothetical protein